MTVCMFTTFANRPFLSEQPYKSMQSNMGHTTGVDHGDMEEKEKEKIN